jgi:membrane-associated PAP2 superfamily phosphatase
LFPSPFLRRHLLAALGLAAALLLVFELTPLDAAIAGHFYDPGLGRFPLRDDWFLEVVMHGWAKAALFAFGFLVLAGLLLTLALRRLERWRRPLLFLFLALALGPGAVAALKSATGRHCPWDLEPYGGAYPHVRLLHERPPGVPPGRCFPGGHAAGGFALMSLYFLGHGRRPGLARAALAGGFAAGLALGFGRMLQGAHFLSHNLWAAWVCWVVALGLYALLLEGRRDLTSIRPPPGPLPAGAGRGPG